MSRNNPFDRQWHFYVGPTVSCCRMVIWAETKDEAIRRIRSIIDYDLETQEPEYHMIDAKTIKERPLLGTHIVLAPNFTPEEPHPEPPVSPEPTTPSVALVFTPEEQQALDEWAHEVMYTDEGFDTQNVGT